jgi:arylsulfatase A-like enzyme
LPLRGKTEVNRHPCATAPPWALTGQVYLIAIGRVYSPRNVPATLYRAGLLAGAAVGLADGLRVALLARYGAGPALATMLLVGGFDTLIGGALGAALGLALGLAAWGRAAPVARWAAGLGWVAAGALAAVAPVVAVAGTASRNNRFLAAGIAALASLIAGALGALLAPALARVLSPRRQPDAAWRLRQVWPAGLVLAAPVVALLIEAALFVVVWRTRAPLPRSVVVWRSIVAGGLTAALPWALARLASLPIRLAWWKALAVAAILFGGSKLLLIWRRWARDFQFVRWNDVIVLMAIIVVAAALALWLRRRSLPGARWRRLALPVGLPVLACAAALVASESEPARKAASARAGFAGQLIVLGQRASDLDRDGHARLFGGGDCDDGDADRNPAAQDWPDDGVDQDCDGKDASFAALRSPPLHAMPAAVPRELKLLFITIDTLRADHCGCYGYRRPTTPVLDALAAQGTVFENGWAHAPSTRYSMPAIATGRWPSAIKWDESIWWPRIDPGERTVGEALKGLGYTTAAFYAYLYFNRADRRGFERGIDHYDDRRAALHLNVNGPMESVGSSARQMADDGIAFLRAHGQEKFFLWMHFYDPHLNYERHPEAPDFGRGQADLYDGEIWFTDHHMGRVFDELKALGLWDKTAIVVTGDHGESLGEHGITAHGYHLYAPHTKVPFVVRVPGLPARRETAPVSHVDLAPTLVNLARGPHEPRFLGRSMVDLLAGTPSSVPLPPVFQEVSYEGNVKRRALVTATHHLIWNWTPDNTTECYDLARDPDESRDLWGTAAGEPECPRLKAELRTRVGLLSLPGDYREKMAAAVSAPGAPAPAPAVPLDLRIDEYVRIVGYDLPRPTVRPGGSTEITVHFEVLAPVPRGWRFFFHLDGPTGGFRNLDHAPVDGAHPVERWRPGQRIRDRFTISFGPHTFAGSYHLFTGLWKGNDRLPVWPENASDGKDRLHVATIEVR